MSRTITTVSELDALPVGSVVVEGDHTTPDFVYRQFAMIPGVFHRFPDGWYVVAGYGSREVPLPARVLHDPSAPVVPVVSDAAVEAAARALLRECDLADADMRKWVRVPVRNLRTALTAARAALPLLTPESVEPVTVAVTSRRAGKAHAQIEALADALVARGVPATIVAANPAPAWDEDAVRADALDAATATVRMVLADAPEASADVIARNVTRAVLAVVLPHLAAAPSATREDEAAILAHVAAVTLPDREAYLAALRCAALVVQAGLTEDALVEALHGLAVGRPRSATREDVARTLDPEGWDGPVGLPPVPTASIRASRRERQLQAADALLARFTITPRTER